AIRAKDIESYKTFLAGQGRNTKTIIRKLRSLFKFFNFVQAHNSHFENPVASIGIPKTSLRKKSFFQAHERQHILEIAKDDPRMYVALTLLFQTGMRISELTLLKQTDFKLSPFEGSLTIQGKFARTIPLTDKAFFVLSHFLNS